MIVFEVKERSCVMGERGESLNCMDVEVHSSMED